MTTDRSADTALRIRAEEVARERGTQAPESLEALPVERIRQTLHELRVHQIELEMQNEELRRAQAELEASRARYFDLYDLAPVGYFTLDDSGLIIQANLSAANLLNQTRDRLVKRPFTRFVFPADQDAFYALRKQSTADSPWRACELRLVVVDKSPVWVRLVMTPSNRPDDSASWLVVVSDISENRRREGELAQVRDQLDAQHYQLNAIFEQVLEGIIICGLDGSVQRWNPAALAIHGITEADVSGLNLPALATMFELLDLSGRVLSIDEWPLSRILRGERLTGLELQIRHTRKVWKRIFSYHGSIICDASGKQLMVVVTVRDITRFKQAEEKIRRSLDHETEGRVLAENDASRRQEALEAVYGMATGSTSDLGTLFDQVAASVCTVIRAPAAGIYECREGRIVRGSRCIDGRVSRLDVPTEPCAACRSVLHGNALRQFGGDLQAQFAGDLCFDGGRFRSYVGVPILDPQNQVIGVICVLDGRKREFVEHETRFVEAFGRYVANELSRRDLESRLRRAEEMRMLGLLTSGVAHEVRNPLNGILAIMSALGKELEGNETFTPYIKHMRSQVSRLTNLMDDLLSLAKPVKEANIREVSLVTLTEQALSTWLQTQRDHPPPIQFNKPADVDAYLVSVDTTQITQVVVNLLENAHGHAPSSELVIVSIFKVENGQVAFTVKDHGPGIPHELLSRIFEPFFTTRKGGTGLGLSIVQQIVASHRGSITAANNTDGPGATFEMRLPLSNRKVG